MHQGCGSAIGAVSVPSRDSGYKLLHRYYTCVYQSRECVGWHGKGLVIPTSHISLLSDCLTDMFGYLTIFFGAKHLGLWSWLLLYTNITHSTPMVYSAIPKSLLERKHGKSFWLGVYPITQLYISSGAVQLLHRLLSILKVWVAICKTQSLG